MWILQSPSSRMFSTGHREYDGASSHQGITVTGAQMSLLHSLTNRCNLHQQIKITVTGWMYLSPYRYCLLERPLIPASTPLSMELSSVDGERLIGSSLTAAPTACKIKNCRMTDTLHKNVFILINCKETCHSFLLFFVTGC